MDLLIHVPECHGPMVSMVHTVPLLDAEGLQEEDILLHPGGTIMYVIREVFPDGAYGCDVCSVYSILDVECWVEMSPEDMVDLKLRIFEGVQGATSH